MKRLLRKVDCCMAITLSRAQRPSNCERNVIILMFQQSGKENDSKVGDEEKG